MLEIFFSQKKISAYTVQHSQGLSYEQVEVFLCSLDSDIPCVCTAKT